MALKAFNASAPKGTEKNEQQKQAKKEGRAPAKKTRGKRAAYRGAEAKSPKRWAPAKVGAKGRFPQAQGPKSKKMRIGKNKAKM